MSDNGSPEELKKEMIHQIYPDEQLLSKEKITENAQENMPKKVEPVLGGVLQL
jgi:hypothetical protein